jgi:ABC-2 type transport system permease protein
MNNNIIWLVRREIWENRSLWIAPLVVAGVILVITAFGGVHIGEHDTFWFGTGHTNLENIPDAQRDEVRQTMASVHDKQEMIYAFTLTMLTSVQMFSMMIVVFFYLLDAVLTERKDRSILFWKSLPLSDTEVVLSKVVTALVVAPLIVLVVSAVVGMLFGPVLWVRFHGSLVGDMMMPWNAGIWLKMQGAFWMMTIAGILWFLPVAAYLLLVSVWARRNAFLWAILPPLALLAIEALLTHTRYFGHFLGRRFIGVFELMNFDSGSRLASNDTMPGFAELAGHIGRVFTSLETWAGVLAGVVMILVVIRIRRFRDDS